MSDTVARGIRIEIDPNNGDMYLVFKIIDEDFKRRVRERWSEDIPLKVLGRELIEIK